VQGELSDLPFDVDSFDLVVCFETIEHVDRRDEALDELRRVLRADGHLLLSSPNRDVFPPGNPHHIHEYTPQELREALQSRFPAVELWRQHTWLASLLLGDDATAAGPDATLDLEARKLTPLEPGRELYTLAIAGAEPLPPLRGSAVLGEPAEIRELVLLEHEIEQRNAELHEARLHTAEAVAGYESSFSWRVTKPLRGAKRIAERFGRGSNQTGR
jgi:SAM-dependent methyltransferase